MLLIPNVVFLLFLLLRSKVAIAKLRQTNRPIFITFYIMVSMIYMDVKDTWRYINTNFKHDYIASLQDACRHASPETFSSACLQAYKTACLCTCMHIYKLTRVYFCGFQVSSPCLPTFWTQLLKKQSTQHCLQSCRLHTVLHTLSLQECKFPGFKLVERACIHLELAKWGQASNTRRNKQMSIHTANKLNHGSKRVFLQHLDTCYMCCGEEIAVHREKEYCNLKDNKSK